MHEQGLGLPQEVQDSLWISTAIYLLLRRELITKATLVSRVGVTYFRRLGRLESQKFTQPRDKDDYLKLKWNLNNLNLQNSVSHHD